MTMRIRRLIGVYNAEGSLSGELVYWVGARLGAAHCALCDITHGLLRERADWRACRGALPVPFVTFHRDDQPPAVRALLAGAAPAVVADVADVADVVDAVDAVDADGRLVFLLDAAALERCAASPDRLVEAIAAAAVSAGLAFS